MGQIHALEKELSATTYPGRGIVIGNSADGKQAMIAYFIMGRSVNSRNRIFVEEGDGLRTQAFDESKLSDPSLIIYAPVRVYNDITIVTNGDQTDTVLQYLQQGKTFEDALRTRTFEPDGPNYTPRISGMVERIARRIRLSILKSANGDPASAQRQFFEYDAPLSGEGYFIHTYQQDGDPLPSFEGEPARVALGGDIDTFTQPVWNALNEDNRVSLFTRFIDWETGETQTRIVNRNV